VITLANLQIPSKKWNLEDDSDEEEEARNNAEKIVEEEEVDPLDAFMQVKSKNTIMVFKCWSYILLNLRLNLFINVIKLKILIKYSKIFIYLTILLYNNHYSIVILNNFTN